MKINRREFLKHSGRMTAGITFFAATGKTLGGFIKGSTMDFSVSIPMPIQIVIDDVGWWSGQDGHQVQQPYRTGIQRDHVPADYQAIADLGRELDIRPQAAIVLCEWDKENILRELPTATWMGTNWDNKKWVGPWMEEAADIIKKNSRYMELTIHGVGHEYWNDGVFTRAEWADKEGVMRPRDQVEAHLDYFERILDQHQLGPLPTSFVPTAFLHGFGLTGNHKVSMARLLKRRGIRYINTPFYNMAHAERTENPRFGFDDGVLTVDRGDDLLSWYSIGKLPQGELPGPTCGLHWPNLLHSDPLLNSSIVQGWIKFLAQYDKRNDTMLAKDSADFCRQLLHYQYTKNRVSGNYVELDFSGLEQIPPVPTVNVLTLKIQSKTPLKFETDRIKITQELKNQEDGYCNHRLLLVRNPDSISARIKILSA